MNQRKVWSQEVFDIAYSQEDMILKKIITQYKVKKWCLIAKLMGSEFKIEGRTGKQCRQRWHNKLNPIINSEEWTFQEQIKLFQYHELYGNKWSKISMYLPGRSDNSIKNHFYSTLRKAFRGINRHITKTKKNLEMNPLKNTVLNEILCLAQDELDSLQLNEKVKHSERPRFSAIRLKNRLIQFAKRLDRNEQCQEQCEQLLNWILEISKYSKNEQNKMRKKIKMIKQQQKQDISYQPNIQQQVPTPKIQNSLKQQQSFNENNKYLEKSIKKEFGMEGQSVKKQQPTVPYYQFNQQYFNLEKNYYPFSLSPAFIENLNNYYMMYTLNSHECCKCHNRNDKQQQKLESVNNSQGLNIKVQQYN